ncbi:MAG: ABC transporter ATP-binding protein, partial [Chloroflexi bacterium]|nr:ABC transporter ATP-binding protein [Chloroflexota bacterium]
MGAETLAARTAPPKQEFTVADAHHYDRRGPLRWIAAHIARYPYLPLALVVTSIAGNGLSSYSRLLVGSAFRWIQGSDPQVRALLGIVAAIAANGLGQALFQLARNTSVEFLAQLLERDCREELYRSLLGKSLAFHDRHRVGDLMARATNDVRQINMMVNPGLNLIFDSLMSIVVPIITIASLRAELLLVPALFVVGLFFTLRRYMRQLSPVLDAMRHQFGVMNADLAESISGIEVIKANTQEEQEQGKFAANARSYRDLFIRQVGIQARYLPFLVYSATYAAALAHGLLVYLRGDGFDLGNVVAYVGLVGLLRMPTFFSIFSFSQVQMGIASAGRILDVLNATTELDENVTGVSRAIEGRVTFEDVTFGYSAEAPVLCNLSFDVQPGETIAIVGGTGSGKSSLTRLIGRTYDVTAGRVLVDGVDVREWNLDSLRSQISAIEQDVFLFSRSLAENIAFGVAQQASREEIEAAARQAQAHEFIQELPQGYDTEIGERGVTLSGGQ